MKNPAVVLLTALLLSACNSSSSVSDNGGSASQPDGDGSCAPPTFGMQFTHASTTLLADGCLDTGDVQLGDSAGSGEPSSSEIFAPLDGADATVNLDIPQTAKGLYIYTNGGSPVYLVAYSKEGFYQRAGELGLATVGPGVYYLPFNRTNSALGSTLNGLTLSAWGVVPGQSVGIREVTWADMADDVRAQAKLHWRTSTVVNTGNRYPSRHLLTLAASGHPLRQLTHALSEEVLAQYIALSSGACRFTPSGNVDIPAVQFVDFTGELGQAWSGRDVFIRSADDLLRKVYTIAIDWNYASGATVAEIIASIDSKDYLWPDFNNPANDAAACLGQLGIVQDFDDLRQSVLDGGDNAGWTH